MSEGSNNPQTEKKGMSTGVKVFIGCVVIVLLGIGAFILLTILGCAGLGKVADEASKSIEESEETKEEEEEDAWQNAVSIGEFVVTENVEWKVDKVEDLGSTVNAESSFIEEGTTKGKFIRVTFSVKNNDKAEVWPEEPVLMDSNKNEYKCYDKQYMYIEDDVTLRSINPGMDETFQVIYDIPKEAIGLKLQVHGGNLFDPVIKYVDLAI